MVEAIATNVTGKVWRCWGSAPQEAKGKQRVPRGRWANERPTDRPRNPPEPGIGRGREERRRMLERLARSVKSLKDERLMDERGRGGSCQGEEV